MIRIAIVILDYKNKKDTLECLASLNSMSVEGMQVSIVLVNNDTGTTYEEKEFYSAFPIKLINSTINSGFTGGNNIGITHALEQGAEYILLLNNDTLVHKNLLKELLSVMNEHTQVGLISPKIYFAKGYEFHKQRYSSSDVGKVFWYAGGIMDWKNVLGKHRGVDEVDSGQYDTTEETDFATGCCMLFRSETIKKVGLFNEKYFLYYEDSDLNQRMKQNNYHILYAPKAILWHKNAGSTGGSGSQLQDYFITRNRLMFGMQYASLRAKIALVKESLLLLKKGRVWQKIGIKDFYLGKFGKGSYQIS